MHVMDEEPSLIHSIRNFLCDTQGQSKISDPGGNRTHDLRIRSPLLYWTELQGQTGASRGCLRTNRLGPSQVLTHPVRDFSLSSGVAQEVPDAVDQRRFFIHRMHTVALASLELSPYTYIRCLGRNALAIKFTIV